MRDEAVALWDTRLRTRVAFMVLGGALMVYVEWAGTFLISGFAALMGSGNTLLPALLMPNAGFALGVVQVVVMCFIAQVIVASRRDVIRVGAVPVANLVWVVHGVVLVGGALLARTVWAVALHLSLAVTGAARDQVLPSMDACWAGLVGLALCLGLGELTKPSQEVSALPLARVESWRSRLGVLAWELHQARQKKPGTGPHAAPLAGSHAWVPFSLRWGGWLVAVLTGLMAAVVVALNPGAGSFWVVAVLVLGATAVVTFHVNRRLVVAHHVLNFVVTSRRSGTATLRTIRALPLLLASVVTVAVATLAEPGVTVATVLYVAMLCAAAIVLPAPVTHRRFLEDSAPWWQQRLRAAGAGDEVTEAHQVSALVLHDYLLACPIRVQQSLGSEEVRLSEWARTLRESLGSDAES